MWIGFTIASAVFTALTAIIGKASVAGIDSNLATFLRGLVVVLTELAIVLAIGTTTSLTKITKGGWLFIVISGITTAVSGLLYYKALQLGEASRVQYVMYVATIITTLIIGCAISEEAISIRKVIGIVLLVVGAAVMTA